MVADGGATAAVMAANNEGGGIINRVGLNSFPLGDPRWVMVGSV